MQSNYKAIIIGGGASGILSAIELTSGENAISGQDVLILERNDRIGKKLIATGNGQGNLSNANISEANYYGDKGFFKAFYNNLGFLNIQDYFYNLCIPFCTAENGRQYPVSKQASAVLDILMKKLSANGVQIETKSKVTDIQKQDNGFKVVVDSKRFYFTENVIVCVGGSSARQFGTDGTSYSLLEKFGHKKTKLLPSLVQLKTETENIKGLKGIKEKVRISAFDGAKLLKSVYGDVLFTEYGISGDTVFTLSATLADKANPYVIIEFMPELSSEQISKLLEMRVASGFFPFENILDGLINKKLAYKILKIGNSKKISAIVDVIQNFKLKVTGTLGFDYSQVTKGGISTDAINPLTFESKLVSGLYACGEVLNIDGDCGGYNLNFAFLSGILAGKNIKNNLIGE